VVSNFWLPGRGEGIVAIDINEKCQQARVRVQNV